MKSAYIMFFSLIASFSISAMESGKYINPDYTQVDAPLYKSLEIDSAACGEGGVIAKFYGADPMNFCIGNTTKRVFKYKKCLGKEINSYPIKACLGVKREAEMVDESEVTYDSAINALVLFERNTNDKKVQFEQESQLIDIGDGKIKLIKSFKSYLDGREGTQEFIFQKN